MSCCGIFDCITMCFRSSRKPTHKKPSFESMAIEKQIETILTGGTVDTKNEGPVVCDYSVEQQFKDLRMPYNRSDASKLIVKETVFYKVAAVVFNDKNEVLMIQERKRRCRGMWCLPSGKVEPNEQLVDAVTRETLEESGLRIQPTALVVVEHSVGHWFRFTFTGRVIGGQIKTDEDEESMKAQWFSDKDLDDRDLRRDKEFTKYVIDLVRNYNSVQISGNSLKLPVIRPHNQIIIRIMFLVQSGQNSKHHYLVSKAPTPHLPVCEINREIPIFETIVRLLQKIFVSNKSLQFSSMGLLRVEHNGVPMGSHEGICFTILVHCPVPCEDMPAIPIDSNYTFVQLMSTMEQRLNELVNQNIKTIAFLYIPR